MKDDQVMEAQARCLVWNQVRGLRVEPSVEGDKVPGAR